MWCGSEYVIFIVAAAAICMCRFAPGVGLEFVGFVYSINI